MILDSAGRLQTVNGKDQIKTLIMNWEVDGDGNTIYVGHAAAGTPNSVAGWYIQKIVNPTPPGVGTIRLSGENRIWDDRASLTYT